MSDGLERYLTSDGARIYRWPIDLFPGLHGYAHLLLVDDIKALIDAGSGFGDSNAMLEAGLNEIKRQYNEPAGWGDLTHVLITHGHIDHFGGLPFVLERSRVSVGVHELDRRVLSHYEERLAVITPRMSQFLLEAGVEPAQREGLMDLYLMTKHLYASQPVDFTFEASGMRLGDLELLHVPGHCPGQVVLRVDDILLSGDHVLPDTSPHQSPEELSQFTGLGHYLESLRRLKPWAADIRWTLGGHERAMDDLGGRLESIEAFHGDRLRRVHEELEQMHTIAEVSEALFPGTTGYHAWLALEETAAHIEYLLQRGALGRENLDTAGEEPVRPWGYRQRGPLGIPLEESPEGSPSATTRPIRAARESAHGGIREERVDVRL